LSHTLVLLVGMQGILGEIIRETLAAEPDMEVIGELTELRELRHLPPTTEFACPDAVIALVGHRTESAGASRQLLRQRPPSKLLIISEDGRRVSLYGEAGDAVPFDDPSPSTLVEAIRGPTPLTVAPA
jgi:DNA-binding NarL/FixJ family response regulator